MSTEFVAQCTSPSDALRKALGMTSEHAVDNFERWGEGDRAGAWLPWEGQCHVALTDPAGNRIGGALHVTLTVTVVDVAEYDEAVRRNAGGA